MLCRKYAPLVQAFTLSGLMSLMMSLVITLLNIGFVDNLFSIWMRAWVLAYAVAFPTILMILPVVKKMVSVIASKEAC